jgi:DNA-binding NarL/FixJ family response regulator
MQRMVLRHVIEGSSSSEIAERLGISCRTVEDHRAGLLKRLSFKSTRELIVYALRHEAEWNPDSRCRELQNY